jgi:cell division septum initiation protein DivIVA
MDQVRALTKNLGASVSALQQELATREESLDSREKACQETCRDLLAAAEEKCRKLRAAAEQEAAGLLARANAEREAWEIEKQQIALVDHFSEDNPKVTFDVGGQHFSTYLSVLTSSCASNTMLGALFSGRH